VHRYHTHMFIGHTPGEALEATKCTRRPMVVQRRAVGQYLVSGKLRCGETQRPPPVQPGSPWPGARLATPAPGCVPDTARSAPPTCAYAPPRPVMPALQLPAPQAHAPTACGLWTPAGQCGALAFIRENLYCMACAQARPHSTWQSGPTGHGFGRTKKWHKAYTDNGSAR
jgi:hypothetical protein